jgi:23S rRNA (cytidine1920-2'-O)/16S rRNA (cytidine1409-2'-O)-methyltransferase
MARLRIDQLLLLRGLAPTRARAQALLMAGDVFVGQQRIVKAGTLVDEEAAVLVRAADHPYVSRGGVKLAGALDAFALDVKGLRCLDLGASTGGFTDCLLQRGAREVIAVDVGYGQLAHKLRKDARVTVMERTNARGLQPEMFGGAADFAVVDASFIGLAKLMPALARCTRSGGTLVALVKPQFEAGREHAARGRGVIRDPAVRLEAVARATGAMSNAGFEVLGQRDSVLQGPKGNQEAFVYARRREPPT